MIIFYTNLDSATQVQCGYTISGSSSDYPDQPFYFLFGFSRGFPYDENKEQSSQG